MRVDIEVMCKLKQKTCHYYSEAVLVRSGKVYREISSQVLTFNWEAGAASSSFLFPRLEGKWMVADFVP